MLSVSLFERLCVKCPALFHDAPVTSSSLLPANMMHRDQEPNPALVLTIWDSNKQPPALGPTVSLQWGRQDPSQHHVHILTLIPAQQTQPWLQNVGHITLGLMAA